MDAYGKKPYVNTIAAFLTRRCYEPFSPDLSLQKPPVRSIGSGGGAVCAPLGSTRLANVEMALLSAISNMTIVAPCDAEEHTVIGGSVTVGTNLAV